MRNISIAAWLAVVVVASSAVFGMTSSVAQQNCQIQTSTDAEPSEGKPFTIDQTTGLAWGDGNLAVLFVHGAIYDAASWQNQAADFADHDYLAVALEESGKNDIETAIDHLVQQCAIDGVVVVGASAGASASFSALASMPDGVVGFIVLAGTGDVAPLGDYPKLFVSAVGDGPAGAITDMAASAPGDQNALLLVPGSEHAQAIFKGNWSNFLESAMIGFVDSIGMTVDGS